VPSYFGRTPSLGNSQSIVAGARVGWRVQVNEAPATSVTIMMQAHLDALNAAVDAPKPIAPPATPKSKCLNYGDSALNYCKLRITVLSRN